MKKIMILLMLVMLPFVQAKGFMIVDFDKEIKVEIIERNPYYIDRFLAGIGGMNNTKSIELLDDAGNVLNTYIYSEYNSNYFDFDPNIKKINIIENSQILASKELDYCNDNGKCEPCKDNDCEYFENYITCSDCRSGAMDYFCDLKDDGRCDPDCEGIDADCDKCEQSICIYEDANISRLDEYTKKPKKQNNSMFLVIGLVVFGMMVAGLLIAKRKL